MNYWTVPLSWMYVCMLELGAEGWITAAITSVMHLRNIKNLSAGEMYKI